MNEERVNNLTTPTRYSPTIKQQMPMPYGAIYGGDRNLSVISGLRTGRLLAKALTRSHVQPGFFKHLILDSIVCDTV
jgi:hypothetical protein